MKLMRLIFLFFAVGSVFAQTPTPTTTSKIQPEKLLLAAQAAQPHLLLLEAEQLQIITRLASHSPALPEQLHFTEDGRYAFVGTSDGWITKYDLLNLRVAAQVRAGSDMEAIALSSDGKWIMSATSQPPALSLFDNKLQLIKSFDTEGAAALMVRNAPARRSFIAVLENRYELWEISYNPSADPIYEGLVHDYKMGEGIAYEGYLGVRRTPLMKPLKNFFLDPSHNYLLGAKQDRSGSTLINLDARIKIADMKNLSPWVPLHWNERLVLLAANLESGTLDVIDAANWRTIEQIKLPSEARFVAAHPNHSESPYVWVGMESGAVALLDKRTLRVVQEIQKHQQQPVVQISFSSGGRYAFLSHGGAKGALALHNAQNLALLQRLPMNEALGSFSVGGAARANSASSALARP